MNQPPSFSVGDRLIAKPNAFGNHFGVITEIIGAGRHQEYKFLFDNDNVCELLVSQFWPSIAEQTKDSDRESQVPSREESVADLLKEEVKK